MALQKLPTSVQNFRKLRNENALYVDKTQLIHRFITEGRVLFLIEPASFRTRSFGVLRRFWDRKTRR